MAVWAFVFLLFNCMLWCFWSKVKMAIAVIDAAADFVTDTKRLVFCSIWYFILGLIIFLVWIAGMVFTAGIGKVTADPSYPQGKSIGLTTPLKVMFIVQVCGIIWILAFLSAKASLVQLTSCAQYYFSSNRESTGNARVVHSMWMSGMKHSGSLALGSGLHMLVTVLRWVVESLINGAEQGNDNAAWRCVACLLTCCIKAIENMIEYLNRMAYSFMAISGDAYCKSAWNGFILNLKHMMKFYFVSVLAFGFTVLGILTIVGLNTGTFYLIVRYGTKNYDQMGTLWAPISIVVIASLITATLFLGIFDEAISGTIMCLAVDLELNNGESKFGPPSFHEKLDAIFETHKHSATNPEFNHGKKIKGNAAKRGN